MNMKKTELLKLAINAVVDSESLFVCQKMEVIEMLLTEISTQKLVEDYKSKENDDVC